MQENLSEKTRGNLFPAQKKHVDYLINWAVKKSIIYVEVPKTGCTLIKRILQYSEVNGDLSCLFDDVHDKVKSPLKSPHYDEREFLRAMSSEATCVFSFVRNPITRLLSAYLDKIVGTPGEITSRQAKMGIEPGRSCPTFHEFVELVGNQTVSDMDVHWSPQTFLLGYKQVDYDYIGRFEFIDLCIEHLVSRFGLLIPPNAIQFGLDHATNAGARVADFYNPEILRKVRDIYHDDFLYLGYGRSI
ncbi:MAG: sulfotransferase family protein [Halioglobus sp.]